MIRFKYTLFVIISLFFSTGCQPWAAKVISEERGFPKEPKFTIQPKGEYENTGLDFNAVYFHQFESTAQNVPKTSCNYFRFWPNGRVLYAYSDFTPTKEKAESFYHARVGYYQVTGNNLVIELFIPDSGAMNWGYNRSYATFDQDSILEFKSEIGGNSVELYQVYRRINLGELNRQPDW